jgi:hypothetical protein
MLVRLPESIATSDSDRARGQKVRTGEGREKVIKCLCVV